MILDPWSSEVANWMVEAQSPRHHPVNRTDDPTGACLCSTVQSLYPKLQNHKNLIINLTEIALQQSDETVDWMIAAQSFCHHPITREAECPPVRPQLLYSCEVQMERLLLLLFPRFGRREIFLLSNSFGIFGIFCYCTLRP